MVVRVPGLAPDAARSLGQDVARRMAEGSGRTRSRRRLGAGHLKVPVPPATPGRATADLLAQALLKGLA